MRKIITNIGWIFFDKIFRMVASILVGVWIARYLGPADFGLLNYAILFPTIFSSIAGFGLTNVLMVEFVAASNDLQKQHKLVSMGLLIKVVTGCLTYGLTFGLNYILNFNNPILFLLVNITATTLILQSSDIIDTYFQSQTKAKLSVIVKLIVFAIATAIRIYALIKQQSITFFAAINALELALSYGLIVWVYQHSTKQLIKPFSTIIDKEIIKRLAVLAWPIMLTEFFVFIYMKVDQFMIEYLSTNHELGLYGAALRLSETWYFIAIAITTSFYPKIAELWPNNKQKFYKQYQALINILVYVSIYLAVLISIFADQFIDVLYGAEFKGAGVILSVHIWAGVFVFIGVGTNNLMIINRLQTFVLIKTIIGAIVNVILNFWLIPQYGALGASIATLVSYGLSAYGMNVFYTQSRSIFYLQSKSFVNFFTFKWPLTRTDFLQMGK